MPPCLTLSIIMYGSRVKWSNPGKGVAPSPTPWCRSYGKGILWVTLDYSRQLNLHIFLFITKYFQSDLLTQTWNPNRYYHSGSCLDLRVMAMKGYSTLPGSPELEPYHQFSIISRVHKAYTTKTWISKISNSYYIR